MQCQSVAAPVARIVTVEHVFDVDPRVRDVMETTFGVFFKTSAQDAPNRGRNMQRAPGELTLQNRGFTGRNPGRNSPR